MTAWPFPPGWRRRMDSSWCRSISRSCIARLSSPGLFVPGPKIGVRAVLVGYPEQLSIGFDADAVRLAPLRGAADSSMPRDSGKAVAARRWGRWGPIILHMPDGPAFAVLASPSAALAQGTCAGERNIGGQYKGYVLDKQERPAFHYILNDVLIEEQAIPEVAKTVSLTFATFRLTASKQVECPVCTSWLAAVRRSNLQVAGHLVSRPEQYSVKVDAPGLQPIGSFGRANPAVADSPHPCRTTKPTSKWR